MNNYSEFQVNIFSNNRDIRLHLENSKSKKGHNFVKKSGGLPPLLVWVSLLIVNNYSEFQVNIFSNNRDIIKCQSFRATPDDDAADDDAKAMTIPRCFSGNSRAKIQVEISLCIWPLTFTIIIQSFCNDESYQKE